MFHDSWHDFINCILGLNLSLIQFTVLVFSLSTCNLICLMYRPVAILYIYIYFHAIGIQVIQQIMKLSTFLIVILSIALMAEIVDCGSGSKGKKKKKKKTKLDADPNAINQSGGTGGFRCDDAKADCAPRHSCVSFMTMIY